MNVDPVSRFGLDPANGRFGVPVHGAATFWRDQNRDARWKERSSVPPKFRPPDLGRQNSRVGENTMNLKCREASEWNSPPWQRKAKEGRPSRQVHDTYLKNG